MTFEIFHFDSIRDELVIDNPVMLEVGALKEVWNRKSKMLGDEKGEKKWLNKKEMMYIFFMANWTKKNPHRNESDIDKDRKAREDCEFPKGWSPDRIVMEAIDQYINTVINATPTLKFLLQVEQTVMQAADQIEIIKNQNEVLLRTIKSQNVSTESAIDMNTIMLVIKQNLNMMFDLLAMVKKANNERKGLEKELSDEIEGTMNIKGKRKIGNRENPM
jgi:hypothetical protein